MNPEHRNTPTEPGTEHRDRADSIPELIRNLATDLSTLLGKQLQLAKAEVRESTSRIQTAIGAIATGGAIAMAGLVILLMSAVYGLSNVMEPWLAALLVGAGALLVGYLMVRAAKEKMNARTLVPDRTVESAKRDKETLKRATQ